MEPQFLSGEKNEDKVKVCGALNQDDIHLLETFPVEVRLHVLDRIWDPEMLYNLSEAALFWRRIMAPRRTEYLFPQVLELLAAEKHLSHVCGNELLKWRFVCKSWKVGVNMTLEKNQDTHRQTFPKHRFDLCGHLDVSIGFALYRPQGFGLVKQEMQQAFEKLYEHCHKSVLHSPSNIFPCRYLIIDQAFFEKLCRDRTAPWTDSTDPLFVGKYFLRTVGHHFWHAAFQIANNSTHKETDHHTVCDHVPLLPNLKSLQITYPDYYPCRFPDHDKVPEVYSTFPTVSNLRVLKFGSINCECAKLALADILRSNGHINVLILTGSIWEGFELPALKSLYTLSVLLRGDTKKLHLPQLPSLRMLRLGFSAFERLGNCLAILRKIKKYRETLTELCLDLPCICIPKDMKNSSFFGFFNSKGALKSSVKPLDLPNIKTLELCIDSCCPMNLLLGLKSLECLRLVVRGSGSNRLSAECSVRACSSANYNVFTFLYNNPEDALSSSIWQLIPSLRIMELTINCHVRTYTRESASEKLNQNQCI